MEEKEHRRVLKVPKWVMWVFFRSQAFCGKELSHGLIR